MATSKTPLPKIERGIPIPSGHVAIGSGVMAILRKLDVGDSFLWPRPKTATRSSDLYRYSDRIGIKLSIRKASPTKNRVWRVE